jgi:hypothetical protein
MLRLKQVTTWSREQNSEFKQLTFLFYEIIIIRSRGDVAGIATGHEVNV